MSKQSHRDAGAKVVQPVSDISPLGEFTLIDDHGGNAIGLHAKR